MRNKVTLKILLFCFVFSAVLYLLKSQLFIFTKKQNLSSSQRDTLFIQASSALESLDVPIGAMILYNGNILSSGYNTVLRDSNAAGHAEINAINNAIRKIGFVHFSKLDRGKLILISTFEPCMMCQGAIIENNIRHVFFMKGKGLFHWLKNDAKVFLYEWNKKKCDGYAKQDSLFMLHPKFKEQNKN